MAGSMIKPCSGQTTSVIEGIHYLPSVTKDITDRIKSFQLSSQDVLIAGYPRSGTNWVSEIVWLICNNVDVKTATDVPRDMRVRAIEHHLTGHPLPNIDSIPPTPPRYIKTNLFPFPFFTQQIHAVDPVRVIHVTRNIKDVLVSTFRVLQARGYTTAETWDKFFKFSKQDYFYNGQWTDHCLQWGSLRPKSNMLFLKYEDIHKDGAGAVRDIASFLGKSLSEEDVRDILSYCTVGKMRENMPAVRKHIIGSGQVGGWKDYFSQEQSQYIDDLLAATTVREGLNVDEQ